MTTDTQEIKVDAFQPPMECVRQKLAICGLNVSPAISDEELLKAFAAVVEFITPRDWAFRQRTRAALAKIAILPHFGIDGLDVELARHIDSNLRASVRGM